MPWINQQQQKMSGTDVLECNDTPEIPCPMGIF